MKKYKVINFNGKNLGFFQNVDSAVRLATFNDDVTSTQQVVDVTTLRVLFANVNGHTEWF